MRWAVARSGFRRSEWIRTGWNILGDEPWSGHARNFALFAPMNREIAALEFDGKLKTAVEEPGQAEQEVEFGEWQATVAFGFPQPDGRKAPGTKDAHGVAMIARLGPDEFLVTGFDASIRFHVPGQLPFIRSQVLTAEEGGYVNGEWKTKRLLNGDEVDRGLSFHAAADSGSRAHGQILSQTANPAGGKRDHEQR